MTFIRRHRMSVTTTATGGAAWSTYTPIMNGLLLKIDYKHGSSGSTASGVSTNANLTITTEYSSDVLVNCTATGIRSFAPRFNIQSTAGATVAGFEPFPVADERLKITFSSAGTASGGLGPRALLDFYVDGVIRD